MRLPLCVALLSPLPLLAACAMEMATEDDGDIGAATEAVTCPPVIRRHPVAGPHNTGYDGSWSDFRCDGSLANTDYGGDHHGIDIFAPRGTPVVSPVDGVVIRSGVASSISGNRVTVQDGCGWAYYHGHLNSIAVPVGARVRAGDPIGTVGNTGTPTAPHVHFNVARDGNYNDDTDPMPLLRPVENSSCGPDAECAGRGDGAFCVDATRRGTCAGGRYSVGDCAAYGTTCDMDTGAARCTPHLDGVFVGSDFPGGTRIEVPLGSETRGCLTYRNTGSWAWDPGPTRLGTSGPRDRASEHAGSDWIAPHRLAAVEVDTPPGSEGRFCFSIHAAATLGERQENFSLVHEGQFWAADVGGVADTVNRLTVVTVEAAVPPPSEPEPEPEPSGAEVDGGAWSEGEADGGAAPSLMRRPAPITGGCSAATTGNGSPTDAVPAALVALGLLALRRRRRH